MAIAKTLVTVAVGAIVVATAGAAVWYMAGKLGGGGPSLLDDLDAANTVAAGDLRHLDQLAQRGLDTLGNLPSVASLQLPKREEIVAKIGGDPAKPEAWANWGLDPALGLAFAMDRRVVRTKGSSTEPIPILLAHVTDRAKLQAGLGKAGVTITLGKQVGAAQELTVAGAPFWLATRGETLAIIPVFGEPTGKEAAATLAGFEGFLRTEGPKLSAATSYRNSRKAASDPMIFVWSDNAAVGQMMRAGSKQPDVDFYTGLFPHAAAWMGTGSGMRLEATEAGRTALAEIAKPKRNPPRCARLFPKTGWAAARSSVNLVDMIAGAGKLLPPSAPPATRTGLAMSTGMLAFVGVGWGEITDALSGHACGGVDVASAFGLITGGAKAVPQWLAAVGIVDAPKADALVAKAVSLVQGKGGATATPTDIAGNKGWTLQLGPVAAVVVRFDDVLLIGPSVAAVQAAIDRKTDDSLAATSLKGTLDGNVIFGFGTDVQAGIDLAKGALAAQGGGKPADQAGLAQMISQLQGQRYAGGSLSLDDEGLLLRGEGDPQLQGLTGFAVPALAALAIPNFLRYKRQAIQVQATMELNQIGRAAIAYFGEPHPEAGGGCQFPATTGPNPPQSCCDPLVDKDGDHQCDPGAFASNPVWQALRFAPDKTRYQYAFESSGTLGAAVFTARAYGDADCDGNFSTFALRGHGEVDSDGRCSARLDGAVEPENADE